MRDSVSLRVCEPGFEHVTVMHEFFFPLHRLRKRVAVNEGAKQIKNVHSTADFFLSGCGKTTPRKKKGEDETACPPPLKTKEKKCAHFVKR